MNEARPTTVVVTTRKKVGLAVYGLSNKSNCQN